MTIDSNRSEQHAVILFDGVCNVCHSSVQFIIRRDREAYFRFASLQSETAASLLSSVGLSSSDMSSIVLLEGDRYFTESTAVLRICKRLDGLWSMLYVLRLVPSFIRDPLYRLFAKNRYRFFGKKDQCMVPTPDIKERFLDDS
ncbi:thiol-disulfide oxidoreductase DCC family protein [Alteribacillus iranensis]|uniref:Predicted thiol-disulfide oxidoreductase YuxK, DCC family n=1 Tax=Alteribacillus iranensis TaxID=930128 RepID=A0A1I2D4Q2_9BACI|nr:DCC1-like thiol-disulfide oxidoreductase family protein [Alteribacillus iranensis]SFE75496.1 Predicted thiol-disulfide oxidoreductase YuxK, DCC family [Alteribacillus iranensis]